MGMAATRTSPLLKAFAATQGIFTNHTPQGDPGASWGHLGAACGRRGASWGALRASQGRRFLLGVRAGGRAQGELAGERAKVSATNLVYGVLVCFSLRGFGAPQRLVM